MTTSPRAVANVVATAASERPDPECCQDREDAQAEQRVHPDQARGGGSSERSVREWHAAGKAEPRRTTKKPTTPAIAATIVAHYPGVGHEGREHRQPTDLTERV